MKIFVFGIFLFGSMGILAAQFEGPDGGPYLSVTIKQLKTLPDDSRVELEGYIIQRIEGDNYLFRDDQGTTVRADIDDDVWQGQKVGTEDRVLLRGEWDKSGKDKDKMEVDVEHIQLL